MKARPTPLKPSAALDLIEKIAVMNSRLLPLKKRLVLVEDAKELPSPQLRASKDHQMSREIAMLLKENYNGILVDIADTNSMDPWIDAGHQALMVPIRDKAPFRVKDLIAGDIIMFTRSLDGAQNVLHRIITIDKAGMVLTRGDNTLYLDGRTQDKDIKYVCVGVLY